MAVFKRNTTIPNPKTLNLEVPSTSKLKPRIKLLNLKALSILRMPEPQLLNSLRPPAKSRMCKAGSPGAGPRSSPQRARKAGPVVPVHGSRVQSLKVWGFLVAPIDGAGLLCSQILRLIIRELQAVYLEYLSDDGMVAVSEIGMPVKLGKASAFGLKAQEGSTSVYFSLQSS